jgi:hypothetical protein
VLTRTSSKLKLCVSNDIKKITNIWINKSKRKKKMTRQAKEWEKAFQKYLSD